MDNLHPYATHARGFVASRAEVAFFSRTGAPAYQVGKDYLKGSPIRQEYLETAIKWISNGNIEDYMGKHQTEPSAVALWNYFQSVINWVKSVFKEYRKCMKGVDWGKLYRDYKDAKLVPEAIEEEIAMLVYDEYVTNQAGIYPYSLTREERHLKFRSFSDAIKQRIYEIQDKKCKSCKKSATYLKWKRIT